MRIDFRLENAGSVSLLYPLTDRAFDWIQRNTQPERTWFAGALVIEHRFVEALIFGLMLSDMNFVLVIHGEIFNGGENEN